MYMECRESRRRKIRIYDGKVQKEKHNINGYSI